MKWMFLIVTGLLVTCLPVSAGSLASGVTERIRSITLEGFDKAYNFDFAGANKIFDEASGVEPLHPRPYVGKAMIELWRYLISKNDSSRQSFLVLADRAIDAAEKYEDRFGEDAESRLCLGTIYGYRAFVNGKAKSYLKAAWDGKKSYDYYVDALQLEPHTYDAYLGLGVFHYFMDFLPKPMKWVASVMGISGDAKTGLRELRVASEKGFFARVEAQFYLAQFSPWMEGEFESGEKILIGLAQRYPSNMLFAFTRAVWEMRRNDVRSAREHLTPLVDRRDDPTEGIRIYGQYKLAECLFRLGMYNDARQLYQSFLREYHDETYRATASYRIGICFEMTGRRDSALGYYKHVSRMDHKFGDDMYSARRAGVLLKLPMQPDDSLLIIAQNALCSGGYDRALSLASQLQRMPNVSADMSAEAQYLLAESFFEKKSYQEALESYRSVSVKKPEHELWITPWAHYQSGLCLLKLNDRSNAKKEFERTLDYEDYDFNNWLEFRAKREIEKIESKP